MSAYGLTDDPLAKAGRDDRFDLPDRKGRPGRLPPEGSSVITRRITALALALGVFMAAGKLWLLTLTGSVGVLSSLVHSGLDMVAAASSFIAVRFAARAPNGSISVRVWQSREFFCRLPSLFDRACRFLSDGGGHRSVDGIRRDWS